MCFDPKKQIIKFIFELRLLKVLKNKIKVNYIFRIIILLVVCSSSPSAFAQTRADSIRMKILSRSQSSVLVAAHRGHWRYSNENSLSGIKNAIKIGTDIIEVDIQRTKDGHFILMHDETLDRTTTGSGRVDSVGIEYIKGLKLRNGIGVATSENIPTLEEVLNITHENVLLNIDKADRYVDEILQFLIRNKMEKAVIIKTDMPFADVRVRFHDYLFTDILLMPVIDLDSSDVENDIVAYLNFFRPKAVEFIFSEPDNKVAKTVFENLNGKNYLWYNTMWADLSGGLTDDRALEDEDGVYGYMIDSLGANIIQTDRPVLLLDYLRKRGLHD